MMVRLVENVPVARRPTPVEALTFNRITLPLLPNAPSLPIGSSPVPAAPYLLGIPMVVWVDHADPQRIFLDLAASLPH